MQQFCTSGLWEPRGVIPGATRRAGRVSRADKARVFGIARAEAGEAAAAAGDADEGALEGVMASADWFIAMMTGLIR